jgi:LysM repeat protein
VVEQAPPPPPPAGEEYTVAKGDSFYSIGKKFGVTMKAIQDANPGVDSKKLKVGQKLHVPAGAPAATTPAAAPGAAEMGAGAEQTYAVKSGDSLTKIAKEFATTVKAIRAANSLTTDKIKVGQKLKIPAKASAPAPAPVEPAPPTTAPAPAPAPAAAPSAPPAR